MSWITTSKFNKDWIKIEKVSLEEIAGSYNVTDVLGNEECIEKRELVKRLREWGVEEETVRNSIIDTLFNFEWLYFNKTTNEFSTRG